MCTGPHPFIPAANAVRAEMIYDAPGGAAENVLHFSFDVEPDEALMAGLAEQLREWHNAHLRNAQSGEVALRDIVITRLSADEDLQVSLAVSPPRPGLNATPVLPSNVTLAIKFVTGLTGRSNRGRAYHIGMAENMVSGDVVESGFRDTILSSYLALLDTSDFTDAKLAIVSYCNDGVWRLAASVREVVGMSSDWTLDSQRRRLLGRGS